MLALMRVPARAVVKLLLHIWTSIFMPLVVGADDPPDAVQAGETIGEIDQEEPEGDEPPRRAAAPENFGIELSHRK